MESVTMERRSKKSRQSYSAFDSALIRSKRDKKWVDLVLALDLPTTDDGLLSAEETIAAEVCHVDTYSVLFKIKGKMIWIAKAHLVGVWVR